jgi:hypothetical protein
MHPAPVATSSRGFFSPHPHTHPSHSIPPYHSQPYHRPDLGFTLHDTEGRKYLGLSQLPAVTRDYTQVTPVYLEAPIRDGLRTPPSDDMNSTASYPQQYSGYHTRKDVAYSNHAAVQSYPATTQPLHGSNHSALPAVGAAASHAYIPVDSPQSASTATIGSEDILRRKSVILPSLQIPPSINSSGGSLGEFAARVWMPNGPS